MAKRIAKTGIDISARMFYAALVCVSTEETRYYLNGVHVEPHPEKGVVLVATDGLRMIVIHDEAGYAGRKAIIPADKILVEALARSTKEEDARLFIDVKGIIAFPSGNYIAANNTLIDGTYPEWTVVVEPVLAAMKTRKVAHSCFNPRLITSFVQVATRLKLGDFPSIKIVTTEEGAPSLILFAKSDSVFGLLMPMRSDIGGTLPIFMKPILSARPKPKPAPKPKTKPAPAKQTTPTAKPRRRAA
ncbi:MAG: hypothetical protein KF723_22480 [Rhizobiaceae bacterium]|nr:hypothetical protein [Rhizobiaceae bacterium]